MRGAENAAFHTEAGVLHHPGEPRAIDRSRRRRAEIFGLAVGVEPVTPALGLGRKEGRGWKIEWIVTQDGGSIPGHQGEVFTSGSQGKIGMEGGAGLPAVLAGSEHHKASLCWNRHRWKGPLSRIPMIVGQIVTFEIEGKAVGIGDLHPVFTVAVLVKIAGIGGSQKFREERRQFRLVHSDHQGSRARS